MADNIPCIIEAEASLSHTIIFLHGRDCNNDGFAEELFESEASKPVDQPRTLPDLFPCIRWVFPNVPILRSERFDTDMSQWFDMWSVEHPDERPELQHSGLRQSIERIREVIREEEKLVPRERIFFAGISQGFAMVLAVFLADNDRSKKFAGLIGLCSWMPATLQVDLEKLQRTISGHNPSIFLSHSADDAVVPIEQGRKLRDALLSLRLDLQWEEYEDGGHWVNEPKGVDDIASFIRRNMSPGG